MKYRLFAGLLLFAVLTLSCQPTTLTEKERAHLQSILYTGVHHPDPFVRAETFRVLEILAEPALAHLALKGAEDSEEMVKVIAARVLLASGHEEARNHTLRIFGMSQDGARRAILHAAFEYGSEPLQRELTARAIRSQDDELRTIGFERGHLERVDHAVAARDENLLNRTILPELGRFIDPADPVLAAMALAKFVELGHTDRAQPLIDRVLDEARPTEDRVAAAKILTMGRVRTAERAFLSILEDHAERLADQTIGLPREPIAPELLRAATLGAVAAGNTEEVRNAREYMQGANAAQAVEVLEALAENPSQDAEVSLRVAMQDSRAPVRMRAVQLYPQRRDAAAEALILAMQATRFETRSRLARILIDRFAEEWVEALRVQLRRNSEIDPTLALLRDVLADPTDAQKILAPLRDPLIAAAETDQEDRRALASYLVAILDKERIPELLPTLDSPTRYALLEYLLRTDPFPFADLFRYHFWDDLFAIRLICAAGLYKIFGGDEPPAPDSTPTEE